MNLSCKFTLLLISFTMTAPCLLPGIKPLYANPLEILISPLDDETNVSIPVVLTWSKLSEASSYKLQLLNNNEEENQGKKFDIFIDQSLEEEVVNHSLGNEDIPDPGIYYWRVTARINDKETEWSPLWSFVIQDSSWQIAGDDDDDGISNSDEKKIHTDPAVKTLFIRPKQDITTGIRNKFEYWEKFISLFPDSTKPGFAKIPALSDANIEVVVIGADGHAYNRFDDFCYDPKSDNLPCDILDIIHKKKTNQSGKGISCCTGIQKKIKNKKVAGHTYFGSSTSTLQYGGMVDVFTWSWDIKGYTPWGYKKHGYYVPQIFPFPLKNYFQEGAYTQIASGEIPHWINCNEAYTSGSECKDLSPMNLNNNDPDPDPPYIYPPDQTVEFNKVSYLSSGMIQSIEPNDKKYTEDEVLRRTIVHEIGHALLGPNDETESDEVPDIDSVGHCMNPNCIMFTYTIDWEKKGFGNTHPPLIQGNGVADICEHSQGGRFDIRASGIVHNHIHTD